MTTLELAGGPRLEVPEEPEELKVALRDALLSGKDWRDGFSDDICLGIWLWARWQPALEPAGFSRDEFMETVVDYRREVWLWLAGDRQWGQFVTGLAGRVGRRIAAD